MKWKTEIQEGRDKGEYKQLCENDGADKIWANWQNYCWTLAMAKN